MPFGRWRGRIFGCGVACRLLTWWEKRAEGMEVRWKEEEVWGWARIWGWL